MGSKENRTQKSRQQHPLRRNVKSVAVGPASERLLLLCLSGPYTVELRRVIPSLEDVHARPMVSVGPPGSVHP